MHHVFINWKKKLFWGVSLGEATCVTGLYLFMALSYHVTLAFNVRSFMAPGEKMFTLHKIARELLDYGLKLLITLPVWWVIFRIMKKQPFLHKLLVHFITLPLFVITWKKVYYFLCGRIGYGHLTGDGEVWDYYIPMLFYILQFGVFHMYDYYTTLQQQQKIAAELKQLALQGEMNVLKSQIQPHFLFNTLNSISASVPPELEHTRELIAKLAETFRFALRASEEELIPLGRELAFTQAYLELEKERFSDRLQVSYDIDESLLQIMVPPMLLQPLVENALKHGISKSIDGGTVVISIFRLGQDARVSVSDSGRGLYGYTSGQALQKGIGLRNTNQRLMKQYGKQIHIEQNDPRGVNVFFELPTAVL